jgi:ribosome-associated toxin RatA of RatAB toxin-antitoxin module
VSLIAIKYNEYLRSFYSKLTIKKGSGKAIIATARKMLEIIYRTLKNGWVFKDFNNWILE